MSQLNPITIDTNPEHIYFDLVIKNFQSTTQESKQLVFNESRNSGFIPNSGQYKMSITRFQIDTYSIPSYVAEIQPNQSNPNLMIHSVSLKYTTSSNVVYSTSPVYLIWQPVNTYVSVPLAPSLNSNGLQSDSLYYYAYSFEHLIKLFNVALNTAMVALRALVPGGGLNSITSPFMSWDTLNEVASLYCEKDHFDNILVNTRTDIYFNRPAYALYSSFPAYRNNINAANENIYQIRTDSNFGANVVQNSLLGSNKVLIKTTQEVKTITNISPVSSIVFTTTTLPIVPTQLSAPLVYNNGILIPSNYNNNFGLIITDMATNENGFKPTLLYNPSAQFRYISLTGNQPLKNIDIAVWWKDKNGVLNPLLLWSGGHCSIKLLFEKCVKEVKCIN
jgi:hypothetical protein